MARHRPPPIGRNEMVSGAASPETTTNQNKVLVLSKILAGRTISGKANIRVILGHSYVKYGSF